MLVGALRSLPDPTRGNPDPGHARKRRCREVLRQQRARPNIPTSSKGDDNYPCRKTLAQVIEMTQDLRTDDILSESLRRPLQVRLPPEAPHVPRVPRVYLARNGAGQRLEFSFPPR